MVSTVTYASREATIATVCSLSATRMVPIVDVISNSDRARPRNMSAVACPPIMNVPSHVYSGQTYVGSIKVSVIFLRFSIDFPYTCHTRTLIAVV